MPRDERNKAHYVIVQKKGCGAMAEVDKVESFGTMLIESEFITEEQWKQVLDQYKSTHKSIESIILDLKLISADQLGELLEFYYNVPYVKLDEFIISMDAVHLVPENVARQNALVPMNLKGKELTVAMADPNDILALDTLSLLHKGGTVKVVYASKEDIERAIRTYYGAGDTFEDTVRQISKKTSEAKKSETSEEKALEALSEETPVIQLVNKVLSEAVETGVSDIHFEPTEKKAVIRFRIDGILHIFLTLPITAYPSIISRLKIINGMNIAERRLPQDGRARIKVKEREVDIRASTFPLVYGEKMVLRLLDRSTALASLDKLGFLEENYRRYIDLISQPYGMVLITGPTGSGKSTTLFATLNRLKSIHKNIISVEDPVEYQIDMVNQAQVNARIGLDFANSLRHILRQDPDVIMIGEIRDKTTAEICFHAAMTGHMVLSTLHTNDACSSVTRLIEMDVPPYLVASVISGAMAQRLLRCVCIDCREELDIDEKIWKEIFGTIDGMPGKIYRGKGCPKCYGTGYLKRVAITEIFRMSPKIAQLVMDRQSTSKIIEVARGEGLKSLREDAMIKVAQGITTLEEVLRTTLRDTPEE
jgi:type IV pilus assembly protein PilB